MAALLAQQRGPLTIDQSGAHHDETRHRARDRVCHAADESGLSVRPYRFVNREYFIIQYRTDPEALRRIVPEPLTLTEPVMNYEFIRMPDSTGFGDYTEGGQVIPVSYRGEAGSFVHQMFLNDHPPIALVEKQISDIAGQKGISQKEAANELLAEKQPSLEFASPEQLGGTVAFLCSLAADQITGAAISVDGGWTAR